MCTEQIAIRTTHSDRSIYEIEEFLKTLPYINDATFDIGNKVLTVDYDETAATYGRVLDAIENAGCIPSERASASWPKSLNPFKGDI